MQQQEQPLPESHIDLGIATKPQQIGAAVGRLPPGARQRYAALLSALDDADALWRASQDRLRLVDDRVVGAGSAVELEAANRDYVAARSERDRRAHLRGRLEQQLSIIQQHLLTQAVPYRDVSITTRLKNGEDHASAVERLRRQIAKARSDAAIAKGLPPPPDLIKQQVRAEIAAKGKRAVPSVTVGASGVRVEWKDGSRFGASAPTPLSASDLACALHPQKVFDLLMAAIGPLREGIAETERAKRITAAENVIRRCELEEQAIIEAAAAAGISIEPRADVSVFAVLMIEPLSQQELEARAAVAAA